MVESQRPDMIQGTMDLLILKVVSLEPMHGWGICERIQQISSDVLHVNQGSLYASLHRLTRQGCPNPFTFVHRTLSCRVAGCLSDRGSHGVSTRVEAENSSARHSSNLAKYALP